jgi:hypothetical protein
MKTIAAFRAFVLVYFASHYTNVVQQTALNFASLSINRSINRSKP